MNNHFAGARLKLERAEHHFDELIDLVAKTSKEIEEGTYAPWAYQQEYRARSHCIVWTITDVQPANVEWGVILGDAFNNLRAALDYAAWELVDAGRTPTASLSEVQQGRIAFPICSTPRAFTDAIKGRRPKLPGISRKQVALIRSFQPYRKGQRLIERHPLWAMQYVSNRDKHRTIQLAFPRPFDLSLVIGAVDDFHPTRKWMQEEKPIRAEEGTEVLRFYGRRTGPNPRMDVKITSSLEPEIEGRYWLTDAYRFARDAISVALDELEVTL